MGKIATIDGFVRYHFTSEEVLVLEEKLVQVGKHTHDCGSSSATVTSVKIRVFFSADRRCVEITDNYRISMSTPA